MKSTCKKKVNDACFLSYVFQMNNTVCLIFHIIMESILFVPTMASIKDIVILKLDFYETFLTFPKFSDF